MTQSLRAMAEAAAKERLPCTCTEDYAKRDLTDPQCVFCNYDDAIEDIAESVARQFAERAIDEFQKTSIFSRGMLPEDRVAAAIAAAEAGE